MKHFPPGVYHSVRDFAVQCERSISAQSEAFWPVPVALQEGAWEMRSMITAQSGDGQDRQDAPCRGRRLCGDVRGRGDGDELAQDVLGCFQVVLRYHQSFLDVLDGVALRH